jgi:acyl-CoA synthetase (AMP-forming)/AMP-acid ligase II
MSELVERFERLHRDQPTRSLIHVPLSGRSLTVEDVRAESEIHRRGLERLGVDRESLVLLVLGNRPAAFSLWLACRALNVAVLPVDVGATPREIAALAQRFGATVAFLSGYAADAPAIGTAETFARDVVAVRLQGVEPKPDLHRGAAVLKLTSGSTGLPKATFTTESELVADTEHIVEAMEIRPEHTQLAAIPLSHAYGLGNLLVPALIQGSPVILREGFVPHTLAADARTYGATGFPGVPFMFEHLAASPLAGGWPSGLVKLVSAGARLEPQTVRRFFDATGVKIHSFYGTSETGGIAFDASVDVEEITSVGRPLRDVSITLIPEQGAPADGGRVHVAGTAVASRYADEPLAGGAFVNNGFLTGDFGRFDGRGHLVLEGRVSRFINVAGRKIQPDEVEQVLRAMPSIADVRVVGAPDASRGQQIVACVVPLDGQRNVLAVRQFCAARLAVYKVPRRIVWLERIPVTARGKTDRSALESMVRDALGGAE